MKRENEHQGTDQRLRAIFREMDPHKAQEIREAYYQAMEGLRTLADALEMADAKQAESAGPLLTEHLYACEAMDAMKHSRLGVIL